jgi:hypothetical protein
MSKLQEKPGAFKREHPALQKIKSINLFLCLWAFFALLDPDRESGSGNGFRDPIESLPDPDPQHWFLLYIFVVFYQFFSLQFFWLFLFLTLKIPPCSGPVLELGNWYFEPGQ